MKRGVTGADAYLQDVQAIDRAVQRDHGSLNDNEPAPPHDDEELGEADDQGDNEEDDQQEKEREAHDEEDREDDHGLPEPMMEEEDQPSHFADNEGWLLG